MHVYSTLQQDQYRVSKYRMIVSKNDEKLVKIILS